MLSRHMMMMRRFSTVAHGNRVGFIGMGNMGISMAGNLVKNGFDVKGFDLSAETMRQAGEKGIKAASSTGHAASDVDFIVTSLPKTADVEKVLTMDGGVFASASPNTMILDSSTISPYRSKDFADAAREHKIQFVDSPMSGGIMGAAAQTLTFMVGLPEGNDYDRAHHCLSGMGRKIFACGGPGTGQIAKIANNMILGINMVAASEGMALGEKLGIDPKLLCEILSVSSSNSWVIDTTNPRPGNKPNAPASNDYNGGFQVGLIRKDLALAQEVAKEADANVEFGHAAMEYFETLEKAGHGGKDFGYVFQYIMANKKI